MTTWPTDRTPWGELDDLLQDGIDADEPHADQILILARRMILAVVRSMPRPLTEEEWEVAAINSIRLARGEWRE